ncbi:DNA processing protein [Metabacillus crassostreae]|uniref:DNA-processing protein DprA n=1 Tax=Metabacillus crassostreae TaxID=929098 RepID=UPI00195B030B|nr:DNA-processing protein DprA [Metabacillus crassostreae]MBM7603335.1 DNA processing protein [Metabacillus crassostreae]
MNGVIKRVFLLAHCKSVSNQLINNLLKIDPTLTNFLLFKEIEWTQYLNIQAQQATLIKQEYNSLCFEQLNDQYNRNKISFTTTFQDNYPTLLKQIADPPPILFYKGNISLASHSKLLSVVGTRFPSQYGRLALQHILKPLIKVNWVIVSGMAKGIDTIAHEAALSNNGETIAVIAGGLNHVYPKENIPLSEKIITSHLLLSEHPPDTKPQKWHFPMRNRIISGVSIGTIVIQAKRRSGSLITAHQALEQNREVFAVPGSIFEECSSGTNELILSGAKLVRKAEDIKDEFHFFD